MGLTPRERFIKIIWKSDLSAPRFSILIASAIWCILLLYSVITKTSVFEQSPDTYRLMHSLGNEYIWIIFFFNSSVLLTYTLFIDPFAKIIGWIEAYYNCFLWTLITIAEAISHLSHTTPYIPPSDISAESALMLACWWIVIRKNLQTE